MGWRQTGAQTFREIGRLVGWTCLMIDTILMAIFSVWFVWRFFWHLQAYLSRTIFDAPW